MYNSSVEELKHSGETAPNRPASNLFKSRWKRSSKKTKIILIATLATVVLALILGLSLGLALKKNKNDRDASNDYVPSSNPQAGTLSMLTQQGNYYTSLAENASNFSWTHSDPALSRYYDNTRGVDVVIDTSVKFQTMDGFGAALTDSSAYLLQNMKSDQAKLYHRVMDFLFNNATGIQVVRVSMGSSDFSVNSAYSYIHKGPGFEVASQRLNNLDTLLDGFQVSGTETANYVFPVLKDALPRNPRLKIILTPWSPPEFMKTNDLLNSGYLRDGFVPALAQYYVQVIQAFQQADIHPWAMTLQNEPSHLASYPSMGMNYSTASELASELKSRMAAASVGPVKIIGHDDNYSSWQSAANLINLNASAVDAVAFHCYNGKPEQITNFTQSLDVGVRKEIHMTECTGTTNPTTRWSAIESWLDRVYFPINRLNAQTILQWNLALDSFQGPRLEKAYCETCVGALQVSDDDSPTDPFVTFTVQMYLITHFGSATTDLTAVGGGPSVRVASFFPANYSSLSQNDIDCLDMIAYAAPYNTTLLPPPSNASNSVNRRIGMVIENGCNNTISLKVSSDGKRTTFDVLPGLSTFIWNSS